VNSVFVKPAGADLGVEGEPEGELGANLEVLDIDDSSSMAAKVRGKMKAVAIYSNSTDPDRVQGQYFKEGVSPLSAFDGKRFTDGAPGPWTPGKPGMFVSKRGSRVIMDLTYRAKPKLCVTYERTLKQSDVMEGISVMGKLKGEFEGKEETGGPEWTTYAPCAITGVYPNDQFFNVFDLTGRQMDIFSVFVYGGDARDHGLSEVELYD